MKYTDDSLSRFALIGVPSSAGARRTGQERAPSAFRAAGLLQQLRANGLDVVDLGDLPTVTFQPDPEHRRRQNLHLVAAVAKQTADRVDRAVAEGRLPLVLGGDCSLSLGVISGLLRHRERLGLLYFDGDLDLNTPETTTSGVFDGMVLAHVLGRGAPELAGIGPRTPLLDDEDIVVFGYDSDSGWIEAPELEVFESLHTQRFSSARVRANAVAAVREALSYLESRTDAFLVHFDVDVTDLPAVDVPHPRGLDPECAFAALKELVATAKCAAVVVTELNPELDPDGTSTKRIALGLSNALGARAA